MNERQFQSQSICIQKALISEQGNEARPPENLSEDQLNTIPRKHKILHSWSFDAEVGAT